MLRCTQCSRTDADINTCGRGVLPCPPPEEVNPRTHVVLACGPCGITRAVPVAAIVRGDDLLLEASCQRDRESCECKVLRNVK